MSRLLAQRSERGAHVEADALHKFIVKGALWPNEEPREEARRQLDLRARNAAAVAARFFDEGFTVVVDDVVVGTERLATYERELAPRGFALVVLAPPLEVALARDNARGERATGGVWAHLDAEQRKQLSHLGLWLDTARLTPEETVEAILRNAARD